MGADQQTWDYGVKFTGQRSKSPAPISSPTTHQLRHDPLKSRWSCGCGYVLGDGRKAFLRPCPMASKQREQPNNKRGNKASEHEIPNKARRGRRRRAV